MFHFRNGDQGAAMRGLAGGLLTKVFQLANIDLFDSRSPSKPGHSVHFINKHLTTPSSLDRPALGPIIRSFP